MHKDCLAGLLPVDWSEAIRYADLMGGVRNGDWRWRWKRKVTWKLVSQKLRWVDELIG